MMEQLGRMPRPGDSVTIENLVFRILGDDRATREKGAYPSQCRAFAIQLTGERHTGAAGQSVKCINERCSGMRILKMLCGAF